MSVVVYFGYVLVAVIAYPWVNGAQLVAIGLFGVLFFGAPGAFALAYLFDIAAARLPHRALQRALAVTLLVVGSVAFAVVFEKDWLAHDDSRAVLGWLTLPAACVLGALIRLPPVLDRRLPRDDRAPQPG